MGPLHDLFHNDFLNDRLYDWPLDNLDLLLNLFHDVNLGRMVLLVVPSDVHCLHCLELHPGHGDLLLNFAIDQMRDRSVDWLFNFLYHLLRHLNHALNGNLMHLNPRDPAHHLVYHWDLDESILVRNLWYLNNPFDLTNVHPGHFTSEELHLNGPRRLLDDLLNLRHLNHTINDHGLRHLHQPLNPLLLVSGHFYDPFNILWLQSDIFRRRQPPHAPRSPWPVPQVVVFAQLSIPA
mmetsp:Transcript_32282/g.86430  ORF Transcript_32282/g.86430 Transcript_32282/m.86430 type:complete len:236 (-) Transcript_32282:137-844(-)